MLHPATPHIPRTRRAQSARSAYRALVRLSLLATAVLAAACGSPPPPAPLAPQRSALRVMADSTVRLATHVAEAADTAGVEVRLALVDTTETQARATMLRARLASTSAASAVAVTLQQGERIRAVVVDPTSGTGRDYARYWALGRAQLDLTRQRASAAAAAADSAIACGGAPCAALQARAMKTHVDAAAGAAREAESMVRIAMTYVN